MRDLATSSIVLRGGGIIFLIGLWIWSGFFGFTYPWFLLAVTLIAGISFIDDINLPDKRALGWTVCSHGADVLSVGYAAPGYVVGCITCPYCLCGCI